MEPIADAFRARGLKVNDDPEQLAVFDGDELVATVARFGTQGAPPIGEHEPGKYYGATIHRGPATGGLVKLWPRDDIDAFTKRVVDAAA